MSVPLAGEVDRTGLRVDDWLRPLVVRETFGGWFTVTAYMWLLSRVCCVVGTCWSSLYCGARVDLVVVV
jgi:hypothetical protein